MAKVTQADRVLNYIKMFGSISSLEAFADLGITRLSAVIFILKDEGYNIHTEMESARNRFGEKTTYARYSLEKETK